MRVLDGLVDEGLDGIMDTDDECGPEMFSNAAALCDGVQGNVVTSCDQLPKTFGLNVDVTVLGEEDLEEDEEVVHDGGCLAVV